MKINSINSISYNRKQVNFAQNKEVKKPEKDPENPISKRMEQLDLFRASIVAGFGFGARALYNLMDGDFIEDTFRAGRKIADKKYQNSSELARGALGVASAGAIIVGTIGLIAGIYAIYNAPKAMYEGEVRAHKKSEDMDVYLKSNRVEQDLYKQVGDKAKEAKTAEEKAHVEQQYMLLRAAKNQIPEFINM